MSDDDKTLQIAISGPYEAAVAETVKVANGWLERLLGESATEIGGILADGVRNWRARRAAEHTRASFERAQARGIEAPRQVPPAVMIPILEAASLETDEELSDWWIELLTSAADPSSGPVPVIYPRILAELSPLEARVLEWMLGRGFHSDSLERFHSTATLQQVSNVFGDIDKYDFQVIVTNLCRLGLSEPRHYVATRSGGSASAQVYDMLVMTPLGAEFVRACRGRHRQVGMPEASPQQQE